MPVPPEGNRSQAPHPRGTLRERAEARPATSHPAVHGIIRSPGTAEVERFLRSLAPEGMGARQHHPRLQEPRTLAAKLADGTPVFLVIFL